MSDYRPNRDDLIIHTASLAVVDLEMRESDPTEFQYARAVVDAIQGLIGEQVREETKAGIAKAIRDQRPEMGPGIHRTEYRRGRHGGMSDAAGIAESWQPEGGQ